VLLVSDTATAELDIQHGPDGLDAGQLQAYQQQGDPASWAACQNST
jgi:hypothetical protein